MHVGVSGISVCVYVGGLCVGGCIYMSEYLGECVGVWMCLCVSVCICVYLYVYVYMRGYL